MKTKTISIRAALALLLSASLSVFSCKKQDIKNEGTPADKIQTMTTSAGVAGEINAEDVLEKLPQSMLYNLGSKAKLDFDHVEWMNMENYLLVRIPVNSNTGYVYVTQQFNDPADIKAYLVKFVPDTENSTAFSGKRIWINLQDWHMYGIKYKDNVPISHLEPTKLARTDWEACATVTNRLKLDASTGEYTINPFPGGDLPATTMDNPLACPGEESFWEELEDFFNDVFDWVGDLFDGGGSGEAPGKNDDGWGTGGYTGGSSWDWGTVPQIGNEGSGYSGGGWHGPNPGNLEEGDGSPVRVGGVRAQGNAYVDPTILKKTLIKNRLNAIKGAFDEWSFQDIPANSPHMTAQEFQDMVTRPITIDPPNVFNTSSTQKTIHFRLGLTFVNGIDFDFNLELNNGKWDFVSANSSEWGVTIMWDWDQTNAISNVTNNLMTVDVSGTISYTVFVEGIGTIYKKRVKYQMAANAATGSLISFNQIY